MLYYITVRGYVVTLNKKCWVMYLFYEPFWKRCILFSDRVRGYRFRLDIFWEGFLSSLDYFWPSRSWRSSCRWASIERCLITRFCTAGPSLRSMGKWASNPDVLWKQNIETIWRILERCSGNFGKSSCIGFNKLTRQTLNLGLSSATILHYTINCNRY